MKTTTISDREAFELAQGRVPARPDLDSLADLLTAYRSAAIGSAPRPSAALSARLDLSATPIGMRRDAVVDGRTGGATRRAASGLLGVGIVAAIILGAASGAAAVVGAGSAGLLPPGAQEAFDHVVSAITPLGVAGQDTTDQGGAPGDSTDDTTTGDTTEKSTGPEPGHGASDDATITNSTSDDTEGSGDSGDGKGDSGKGDTNSNQGSDNSSNGSSDSGSNSGNGNSGDKGNSGNSNSGNGNSGNGNSGKGDSGNSNSGNGNSGDKSDKHD